MIDHLTLTVRDFAASKAFYERVLSPLGYRVVMDLGDTCGFGEDGKPSLWMKQGDPPTTPLHLAFAARRRADVDAFHAAALGVGAKDNGGPGIRADYHPSYYGAFVFDPDGHPLEAVNHRETAVPRRPAAKRAGAKQAAAKARPAKPAARRAARKAPARRRR